MHDRLNNDKRILTVTAGNLRQSHVYISKHLDFLPKDCVGPARRTGKAVAPFEIELEGLAETIATDIGRDATTGKPRGFIRDRASIGKFFKHHKVQAGARLVVFPPLLLARESPPVEDETACAARRPHVACPLHLAQPAWRQ